MTPPHVSVVMGVYNGARYVEAALESVLSQEDVDLEMIVVDDGSTDETPEILRARAVGDPRLRVITQENTGLTRALIRGCAESQAPLVARQDADDVSLAGRFRLQAAALAGDPGLALVSCATECIGPKDEVLYASARTMDSDEATRDLVRGVDGPVHGSVMFRRQFYEAVGGYRAAFRYAQDSDLWRRLVQHGLLAYLEPVLYRFRVHPAAIGAAWPARQQEFDRLARACGDARRAGRDEAPLLAEAERLAGAPPGPVAPRGSVAYFVGRCLLERRDLRSRPYLLEALRAQPLSPRIWAALARSLLIR